jgi:glutathione S-transferase
MSSRPRLWSWNLSPFAGKARIALAEKAIDYELLEIDPVRRPARLRELNPTNTVPVLELGEVAVRESTAICEWAQEVAPDRGIALWPAGPAARAAARGLLRFVDDELTTPFFLSMRKEAFGLEAGDHPDVIAHLRERLVRRLRVTERLLDRHSGPWMLGGSEPTLVDLAALPLAVRLPQWKPELLPNPEGHPCLTDWFEALRTRPSAREVDRRGEPITD